MDDKGLTQYQREEFEDQGYWTYNNFLSEKEINMLKDSCHRIVDQMNPDEEIKTVFSTNNIEHEFSNTNDDYFLTSGDKVRFFFEEESMNEKRELVVDKFKALNKIGHALHWLVPEFKQITFSPQIKGIFKSLGFKSPAVVQSMYIFKQAGIGGEVTVHKDCMYLSTSPKQTCVGVWIPLEDATLDNGCLWFNYGSHKTPTDRRFIRNPDKNPLTKYNLPADPLADDPTKFSPLPVTKGTLVLIDGQVDHKSFMNVSDKSRHAYTFHVIETHETEWDPLNWLQPTEDLPFPKLYDITPKV